MSPVLEVGIEDSLSVAGCIACGLMMVAAVTISCVRAKRLSDRLVEAKPREKLMAMSQSGIVTADQRCIRIVFRADRLVISTIAFAFGLAAAACIWPPGWSEAGMGVIAILAIFAVLGLPRRGFLVEQVPGGHRIRWDKSAWLRNGGESLLCKDPIRWTIRQAEEEDGENVSGWSLVFSTREGTAQEVVPSGLLPLFWYPPPNRFVLGALADVLNERCWNDRT